MPSGRFAIKNKIIVALNIYRQLCCFWAYISALFNAAIAAFYVILKVVPRTNEDVPFALNSFVTRI